MIEKCAGEFLYGYDVMSKGIDETNTVLWLQKEGQSEKLSLDEFASIDFGLPKTKQEVNMVGGLAGGFFAGNPIYQNRVFTFQTFFSGDNTKKALNSQRIQKINKWFVYNPNEKMFLYWNVKDWSKTYRIEVRPSIASETYKSLNIANGVKITLTAEKPFFESTEETVLNYGNVGNKSIISINNTGIETPFILLFTPNENASYLRIVNEQGVGFEIKSYNFFAGYSYCFNGINNKCFENSHEKNLFITNGTMFSLKKGLNKIQLDCDSDGSITIKARERVL